jgi:hypothetical protein
MNPFLIITTAGSPLFRYTTPHHHIHLATYCLPYMKLPKTPNHDIFTLKMATAMFVETLDNSQRSMWLIPENRSCTLNTGRENVWTRINDRIKTVLVLASISLPPCIIYFLPFEHSSYRAEHLLVSFRRLQSVVFPLLPFFSPSYSVQTSFFLCPAIFLCF